MSRSASIERNTSETKIKLSIDLDGNGNGNQKGTKGKISGSGILWEDFLGK